MKPSVGRIVHYAMEMDDSTECVAAIVVKAYGNTVDLMMFTEAGSRYQRYVTHDEIPNQRDTWHWPERVD